MKLRNSSGANLTQSPITVYERWTYAGDSQVRDLQANEERLISYAVDLGTEVAPQNRPGGHSSASSRTSSTPTSTGVASVIGAAAGAYCGLGTHQYLYRLSLTGSHRFPPPNGDRRTTASDWSFAAYRRGRFQEGVRRRQSARTAPTPNPRPARLLWLGITMVVAGVLFYQKYLTDYADGHRAGVQHVRQVNKEGAFVRAGMNIANALDLIVTDPKQSADWNAEFRVGFKEEIARMYPELGKK